MQESNIVNLGLQKFVTISGISIRYPSIKNLKRIKIEKSGQQKSLWLQNDMDYQNIPFTNILVKEKFFLIIMELELISYRKLVRNYIAALRKLYSGRNCTSENIVQQDPLKIKKLITVLSIMRKQVLCLSWDMKYN